MNNTALIINRIVVIMTILSLFCCHDNPTSTTGNNSPDDQSSTVGKVVDIDGNIYKTIKINNKWWMAENLRTTRYRNGDTLLVIGNNMDWIAARKGACNAYEWKEKYVAEYGRLYNWYAVNDFRKIAPQGWHVATDEDWKELEMFLGMSRGQADSIGGRGSHEGGKLKEKGFDHWNPPNKDATNEIGFNAVGGGLRDYAGFFGQLKETAYFWTSTEKKYPHFEGAWFRALSHQTGQIYRDYRYKVYGFSVRCVRD